MSWGKVFTSSNCKTVLEMINEWAKDMVHVPFGLDSLEWCKKLSTRMGKIVLLEEVLKEAISLARQTS